MDRTESKLYSWLRNQVTIEKPSGPIVRFELRHLPLGNKPGQEVSVIEPDQVPSEAWYESLVAEIIAAADSDASGIGGTQRYVVLAYRRDNKSKPMARMAFRVAGEDSEGDDIGMDSEPPTQAGHLAKLMRHNEAFAKLLVANQASNATHNERVIDKLARQNEVLLEQRISSIELTEELLSHRQERQIALEKAANHEERLTGLFEQVKLLAPVVVNKMAGKELVPVREENNLKTIALRRFLESLSAEQQGKLIANLNEPQKIALSELMQTLQ